MRKVLSKPIIIALLLIICIAATVSLVYINSDSIDPAEPLLATKWGQDAGYAKFSPDNQLVGCWSTALAQILYYHRLEPSGKVQYKTSTGYDINEDLDSFTFDWSKFSNGLRYEKDAAIMDQVGKYVYFTAAVIQKNFGAGNYNIHPTKMVSELEEHFSCKAYWHPSSPSKDNSEVIKKELDKGRPLMLYIGGKADGHAVVIDAYKENEDGSLRIHINMGWAGKDDGWYNFNDQLMNFDTIGQRDLITIEPK